MMGLFSAVAAWGEAPFKVTSIVDGQFAAGTMWYTVRIADAGYYLSDNGTGTFISLDRATTTLADEDLWCFTGNDTDGYRLYNKKAGTGKVLASPATMGGDEGGAAYVVLKDTAALGTDKTYWDISTSTYNPDGFYMNQKGAAANKINNRQGKLAFWTGGADGGSTIYFSFAKATLSVTTDNGTFTASNPTKTWHSNWKSGDNAELDLNLNCGYNNMAPNGSAINAYVGMYSPATYTLSVAAKYVITGYSFDFVDVTSGKHVTVQAGDQTFTSSSEDQHVAVSGLSEQTAAFVLSGSNNGITLKNFTVDIAPSAKAVVPQTDIFVTKSGAIPYRIPAVARAFNGDLIAVADYRWSGNDIGMGGANGGRIDIHARISKDNGKTWGEQFAIVEGKGAASPDDLHIGFGDPCIVADRESNRVLLITGGGKYSFPGGTRDKHLLMMRFYSEDNGQTWSAPVSFEESIYKMFDNSKIGQVKSMFIGSGRIFQSPTVKVGKYYRIYCAVLAKDVNNTNKNYVLYSDDFGENWAVLGGPDVSPVPSGADEPKAEELPDGSIVCSSRVGGGRWFNIFRFTDSEKAEGAWGTVAFSGKDNNGVADVSSSTNGEIMILPALRKADGKRVFVALQSLPMASSRARVGIAYKVLDSLQRFDTPADFAKDWDGRKIVTNLGSAYSTMAVQADSTLAFLYEETTYGANYTIVYKNLTLEWITDSLCAYLPENTTLRDSIVGNGIKEYVSQFTDGGSIYVGNVTAAGRESINIALGAYTAAPGKKAYEALNAAILNAEKIAIDAGIQYRLRNYDRRDEAGNELYLTMKGTSLRSAVKSETDEAQLFSFVPADGGGWYVLNEKAGRYIGKTPAIYNNVPTVTTATASYDVVSSTDGLSYLACLQPTSAGYPALHLDSKLDKIVPWQTTSAASLWYIEPTDIATAIEGLPAVGGQAQPEVYYDLSGRRVPVPAKGGVYVTDSGRKLIVR